MEGDGGQGYAGVPALACPAAANCSSRQGKCRISITETIAHKLTNEYKNFGGFEDYFSQIEAARIIGISKQAMSKLVHRGYFATREVAGRFLIHRSEIESFIAKRKGRKRIKALGKKKTSIKSAEPTQKHGSEEYISQAEAARIRGVTQPSIANLIRRDRLTTISVVGRTLLFRSEVEAFVPQPRTGRPPKKKPNTKTPKPKKSKK